MDNGHFSSNKPLSKPAILETRKITDEMPGGFFIYRADESEEIIYANKALYRLFNCETEEEFKELTGNCFRGLVHPEDLSKVQESIRSQIIHNQYDLDYVEYRIIQKGGAIRWIEDYGHFIHTEFAGDVFYVFLGDATEKRRQMLRERAALLYEKEQKEFRLQSQLNDYGKQLEALNKEQLRRLEVINGLSIDYETILYIDFTAKILQPYRLSPRLEQWFPEGCQIYDLQDIQSLISSYAQYWVSPQNQKDFLCQTDLAAIRNSLSGQQVRHTDYQIQKDGHIEYLQLCLVNINQTQDVTQLIIGCRSISEEIQRKVEQNQLLEVALRQANASNTAKNTFLSNMSHDIRTPLNAIVGYTALSKKYLDNPDKLLEYLDKIETSSNLLIQLLDDVLELSKLEAEGSHMEECDCDLGDIARQVETALLTQVSEKGLTFSLRLDALLHPQVYADPYYLTQALLRLGDNAVKYTPIGGRVTISILEQKAASDFATFQFIVEDTGIGISNAFMKHIFEPFDRQKNTTLSGVLGTGLGLPIVKNIVEIMGGKIDVSSVPGQGSRFCITVSLRLQKMSQNTSPLPQNLPQTSGKRILLVEDNPFNLEIETEILTDAGFLIDIATDGSIAVEKIKNASPGYYALVLMDIQMPVMDGYSATRAIRKLGDPALSAIPIIALSANTFEEDRKKSMESGMNAHMAKPIHIPQLLETIKRITGV